MTKLNRYFKTTSVKLFIALAATYALYWLTVASAGGWLSAWQQPKEASNFRNDVFNVHRAWIPTLTEQDLVRLKQLTLHQQFQLFPAPSYLVTIRPELCNDLSLAESVYAGAATSLWRTRIQIQGAPCGISTSSLPSLHSY